MSCQSRTYTSPAFATSHSDSLSSVANPIASAATSTLMSEALSSEWQKNRYYIPGDRVAFKLGNSPGVAAFECIQSHFSSFDNQPAAEGSDYWKYYPRGFPRTRTYNNHN